MKINQSKQQGFSAFEGILVVLVLVLVGVGGYYVYQRANDTADDNNQAYSDQVGEEETPIESKEDLDSANKELEDINIDELDTSDLEAIEDELL